MESLQAKIKKLQAQADALIAKQSTGVIKKIREMMSKHNLTTADIDAHTGGKKRGPKPGASAMNGRAKATASAKGKLPPKYRNPKTGETWSGHARPPLWIKNVKDRTKFLIAGATATASTNGAGRSKATAQPANEAASKGKLPPKYMNPKTGETWSGHARPPRWIAGVKDRSKFLIDGNSANTAATVGRKAKAAPKGARGTRGTAAKTKGKLPPKYRDPKTGATWSGHARPPVWIKDVKDRSKYLIAS
jgi:DNA-binding protein H-NS